MRTERGLLSQQIVPKAKAKEGCQKVPKFPRGGKIAEGKRGVARNCQGAKNLSASHTVDYRFNGKYVAETLEGGVWRRIT